MRMRNFAVMLTTLQLVILVSLSTINNTYALSVNESRFSDNCIVVVISDEEARSCRNSRSYCTRLGEDIAEEMMRVIGIPSSVTAKIAMINTQIPLAYKYRLDLERYSNQYDQGFTLKYYVEIDKIRELWRIAEVEDYMLPGTREFQMVTGILNDLVNASVSN